MPATIACSAVSSNLSAQLSMFESVPSNPVPQPRLISAAPVSKLTTGCPIIDGVLRGGVPCGTITELVGEASAGKSQLSLNLLLNAQLPVALGGLEGSALYIYTEGEIAVRRLQQLASIRSARHNVQYGPRNNPLDNVYIEKEVANGADLLAVLQRTERLLHTPQGLPLRLIVVDSVANAFRDVGDDAGAAQYADRTTAMFQVAALLKQYADEAGLAVVVINQVSDDVNGAAQAAAARHTAGMVLRSSGRAVVPALGLAWANCISHRVFLSRMRDMHEEGNGTPSLRRLQLVFSCAMPPGECYYLVQEDGVWGVLGDGMEGRISCV